MTGLEGVVVVASHDRVFLDRVCAVIVDLDASHFGVDGDGATGTPAASRTISSTSSWRGVGGSRRSSTSRTSSTRCVVRRRTTARSVSPHNRPPRDNDKFIHHFKGENVAGTISRRVRNVEQRIEAIEKELVPKPPRPLSFGRALTGEARHQGLAVSVRRLEVTGRLRLDHLDLAVGEHLLVTGDNGSGKSTLLNVLAGTARAVLGSGDRRGAPGRTAGARRGLPRSRSDAAPGVRRGHQRDVAARRAGAAAPTRPGPAGGCAQRRPATPPRTGDPRRAASRTCCSWTSRPTTSRWCSRPSSRRRSAERPARSSSRATTAGFATAGRDDACTSMPSRSTG